MASYIISAIILAAFLFIFYRLIRIVPQEEAYVVEQFGKYQRTLGPGFHLVIPFVQRVAYKHILKEEVIDVLPQICVTNDNVQVTVDGILYLKVVDPEKASYGIEDYSFATSQLAQTTMRSEIGKIDLDRSFSERDTINDAIVKAVDEASDPWGIKVTRYEIKDISPPATVLQAMEQQMRAEREKRAEVLKSEGEREARINVSKGEREESINLSRGERQRRINEAEGRAAAIELTASATADGIKEIARTIKQPKGKSAVSLRVAEQFIQQFGEILENAETSVLPMEAAQIRALLSAVLPRTEGGGAPGSGASGSRTAKSRSVGSRSASPGSSAPRSSAPEGGAS